MANGTDGLGRTRRTVLRRAAGVATLGLAGCLRLSTNDETDTAAGTTTGTTSAPEDGGNETVPTSETEPESEMIPANETEPTDETVPTNSTAPTNQTAPTTETATPDSTPPPPPDEFETDEDITEWLSNANNFDGIVADRTGQATATVMVGAGDDAFAFDPVFLSVDPGTTVVWEWTGEGGSHSVVAEDGKFESGSPKSSGTFEHTFSESGIYRYYCAPHQSLGMKGVVEVVE